MIRSTIRFIYNDLDAVSKKLLKKYIRIVAVTFLVLSVCVVFCDELFPDYTTAVIRLVDLLLFADGMTKAFVIPVLFYEIMLNYFGMK